MLKVSFFPVLFTLLFTIVNSENWIIEVGGAVGKDVYVPASFDANVGDTVSI
jgi:hypothetical protein